MKSYKKNWVLNLIKKLRLFLREDKDFNWVLDRFDPGSKIQLILAMVTFLGIILGKWTMQEFLRDLGGGLALLLAMFLLRKMRSVTKDLFSIKLMLMLPEEWQADLQALQKRWIKKKYSSFKVRRLTIKYLSDMYFTVVKIKIENFYFFNRSSKKEID